MKRRFVYELKRPKKDKKLPVVLSQGEVSQILSSVSNIKHKTILMLIYSAGLRVSEVVKLKPEDIDTERTADIPKLYEMAALKLKEVEL